MTENEIIADGGGPEVRRLRKVESWRLDRRGEALGIFQQVQITAKRRFLVSIRSFYVSRTPRTAAAVEGFQEGQEVVAGRY